MEGLTWWLLTFKNGETLKIKPEFAPEIKRQMRESVHLITKDWTKKVTDIASFEKTSEPITETPKISSGLVEDVARVFNTPIIEDEAVTYAWVKRDVTKREWLSHFSKIPSYKLLQDQGSHVTMGYKLAVHLINDRVTSMSEQEIASIY